MPPSGSRKVAAARPEPGPNDEREKALSPLLHSPLAYRIHGFTGGAEDGRLGGREETPLIPSEPQDQCLQDTPMWEGIGNDNSTV